jgi:hypothetical protein
MLEGAGTIEKVLGGSLSSSSTKKSKKNTRKCVSDSGSPNPSSEALLASKSLRILGAFEESSILGYDTLGTHVTSKAEHEQLNKLAPSSAKEPNKDIPASILSPSTSIEEICSSREQDQEQPEHHLSALSGSAPEGPRRKSFDQAPRKTEELSTLTAPKYPALIRPQSAQGLSILLNVKTHLLSSRSTSIASLEKMQYVFSIY